MVTPITSPFRTHHHRLRPARASVSFLGAILAGSLALTACGGDPVASSKPGVIRAIGTENEYANVISQLGGQYVQVSSILNNPNSDPHTFEVSPGLAAAVSQAQLIVQNGVGYDSWMNGIESASPSSSREVISAQSVLGLPNATPNPHLWYDPSTMPAVAKAITADLVSIEPKHASYFESRLSSFLASLQPWFAAIASFKARYDGMSVAVTEPVADYLLEAMGMDIKTPFVFQADIMNGSEPSPEDISLEKGFFTNHLVKVFCYNQQVVDSLTTGIRETALASGVPVVGVYETMPTPGFDFQTWMLAEVAAIRAAVAKGTSTQQL
jgi:zinc/manganese transport system substrate-binding protein